VAVLPEGYRLFAGRSLYVGTGDNASPRYAVGVGSGGKGGEVNQPCALQQVMCVMTTFVAC
jgi:hypothetical protein